MNNKDVMVTILIPCYNGANFLKRCLESCINQTYKNIKILLVNDGSTDKSLEIIEQYQNKDKRINVINQENKGLAETRNVLINSCKTEYCYFLDVDDWVDKDCIQDFINVLVEDIDVILAPCKISDGNKSKAFYITNKINKKTTKDQYIMDNTFFAWNIFLKTEYIKMFKFNGRSSFFEDGGTMLSVLLETDKAKVISKSNYYYFVNKNSLSRAIMTKEKITSSLDQLSHLYKYLTNKFSKQETLPKYVNDQLSFYHCVIFTYIQFQSDVKKEEKKEFKQRLKTFEKNHWKLRYPKRYWKFWYFVLYRLFNY